MTSSPGPIVIDGSRGEGSGGLLRTAIAMSAITQLPLRVLNVRGGSRHPGLDPEDLTLIRALAESCAAETEEVEPGSSSFSFHPSRKPHGLTGRLATVRNENNRGPNALIVLNSLLPIMARTGTFTALTVEGETFGANALSFDAFANVTIPALRKLGLYAYPELREAGFGRESRGEVSLEIEPSALEGLKWSERGLLRELKATITFANLPKTVGDRVSSHLRTMAKHVNLPLETQIVEVSSVHSGVFVTVSVQYERGMGSGTAMGGRGIKSETLAETAFEEALAFMETDCTVDPYLADQLLLPCVLAEGSSHFTVSRLTSRLLTSIWVVKQFVPIHLTVRGSENHVGSIKIDRTA